MVTVKSLEAITLKDADADRVRRSHADAIRELQQAPAAREVFLQDKQLADATPTPIAHGLGRVPRHVSVSVPRGAASAGYINEIRSSAYDRSQYIVLQADDYGATVTVDVRVA